MIKVRVHPIEDEKDIFSNVICKCFACGWMGTYEEMDFAENDHPAYCPICGYDNFTAEIDNTEY